MEKIINFDNVTKENIKLHNPSWPQIPDQPYRILIIWGSGSGNANSLFNLLNRQPDIDNIYTLKIHMKQNFWLKNVMMLE